MKIEVLAIGKTAERYLQDGMDLYLKRLQKYAKVSFISLPDVKNASSFPAALLKEKEGEVYLKHIGESDTVLLLDEKGQVFTSVAFARYLEKQQVQSRGKVIFIIGGAFGFSEEIYQRANGLISLSGMTFSHQLVRVIFFEQLYRAFTILKGEPYHHE